MNNLQRYLAWEHLSAIPDSSIYREWLLYLNATLILAPVIVALVFRLRKRSIAYRRFDRLTLWGYFGFGLTGMFFWFAVDQSLPTFGTRLAVLLWILSLGFYTIFLVIYFNKVTRKDIITFHEKSRKEKYLR